MFYINAHDTTIIKQRLQFLREIRSRLAISLLNQFDSTFHTFERQARATLIIKKTGMFLGADDTQRGASPRSITAEHRRGASPRILSVESYLT